ncbi:MAG: hypothetical protein GY866_20075 [Proteobacteria bacterium]|nr:hypothetical protein [Pseudomonadota bacterium]
MRLFHSLISILLISMLTIGLSPGVFAQDGHYLEDEGDSLWQEQKFLDTTGKEFETMDMQYVGEEEIEAAEEEAKRAGLPSIDLAAALEKDKEQMPDNIVYGIGAGVIIGGWLSLVQQGLDGRKKVRNLTVGILVGGLIGVLVGSKSIYSKPVQTISSLNEDPFLLRSDSQNDFSLYQSKRNDRLKNSLVQLNLHFKF